MGSFEDYQTSFSYTDIDSGTEHGVGLMEHVDPIFDSDPRTAAFKTLGLT